MNPIKARNYRQVERCLADRVAFDHSTISARWEHDVWNGERDYKVYRVRSYWTVIAEYDPETGETWLADNHWGQTTGRHLGYCRRKLPRIRSNDPSALDGIGPNCVVRELEDPGPAVGRRTGRVIETHPLAGAIRVRFDGWPTPKVVKRESVVLA